MGRLRVPGPVLTLLLMVRALESVQVGWKTCHPHHRPALGTYHLGHRMAVVKHMDYQAVEG